MINFDAIFGISIKSVIRRGGMLNIGIFMNPSLNKEVGFFGGGAHLLGISSKVRDRSICNLKIDTPT